MSDERSISGSVKVENKDSVARVAYEMAHDMWVLQNDAAPKVDDVKFIYLVATCARALGGSYTLSAMASWIEHLKKI